MFFFILKAGDQNKNNRSCVLYSNEECCSRWIDENSQEAINPFICLYKILSV